MKMLQQLKKRFGYKRGDLPRAESLYKRILSLPIYPDLKDEEQIKVINLIGDFFLKGKIGIIIQARMTSTRLPGKVLLDLAEKPVLWHVVERCKKSKVDEVIVATTTNKTDDVIVDFCKEHKIKFFRGSEDDVLERYYLCAKEHALDHIIRVTSDCPLIDPDLINQLIEKYFEEKYDYVRIDTDTFPRGFDAEIFSFENLNKSRNLSKEKGDREHVTLFLRKNPHIFKNSSLINGIDNSHIRVTLDTKEDYELLQKVFNHSKDMFFKEIVDFFENNKFLININKEIEQKKVNVYDGSKDKINIKEDYYLEKNNFGFWQVKPSPSKEFLTDFYKNNYSDDLEKINVEDKINTLESFVNEKNVLDIGCGDGAILKKFKEKGWDVSGIEPSMNLNYDKSLNIINEDFDNIKKFEKKDAVILNFVLEHHPEPENFLKKIRDEILKEKGVIMIEVPNDFNELQLICDKMCDTGRYWIRFPDHLNYFSFISIRNFLNHLDFEILYQESSFPLELFILMGENYIKNKDLGKIIHSKRVLFEQNMIKSGNNDLKRKVYSKLSELNIGRTITIYARKNER